MSVLGRLTTIDPREVWKSETGDFTPWLAENLEHLGKVLGLDLELSQSEASVGSFAVDLVARDLGRDRVVIIENQLEPTDHTHLGQIITYAAGLEAGVVIWISREFREEHRQALDWLNRVHEGETEFFGILVELVRIDDSKPAVNFRLVAFPNQWSRKTAQASAEISPKRAAYQQFFQRLLDDLREKYKFTNARAAQPQNWYSFSSGVRGFQWSFSFGLGARVRSEVYIDTGDADQNERILDHFLKEQAAIEKEFGEPLEWERLDEKRACRVACYRSGSIEDSSDKQDEIRAWAVERLLRFKAVFAPRLKHLPTALADPNPAAPA
jgi:hypothetical protein